MGATDVSDAHRRVRNARSLEGHATARFAANSGTHSTPGCFHRFASSRPGRRHVGRPIWVGDRGTGRRGGHLQPATSSTREEDTADPRWYCLDLVLPRWSIDGRRPAASPRAVEAPERVKDGGSMRRTALLRAAPPLLGRCASAPAAGTARASETPPLASGEAALLDLSGYTCVFSLVPSSTAFLRERDWQHTGIKNKFNDVLQ